ncbi:MAG: rhodanese-like domain-containing protein [Bacteroidales bacterium]
MQDNLPQVSTREVKSWITDSNIAIVDIRPIAAYNGWKSGADSRGGHIPGAISLPVKWADFIDWIEIVRHKEIRPEHKIVVYGYSDQEALKVAGRFQGAGYQDVNIYRDFIQHWAADPGLPMEKMERYRHLVYPDWVHQLVTGESPPEYDSNSNFVICHAHYRNYDDYLLGHIPGAIALDTLELESPQTWNRRSAQELKAALEKHGITSNTTVVLYGRYSFPDNNDPFPGSSAGQLAAIRCAMIMLYAGVKDVRLLNGGMATWETENKPVETTPNTPEAVADFGGPIPAHPELIVDMEEARQLLKAHDGELVCTRSWPEYIGEVSGYNYIEKKGRIPGAVYVNNGSDAYNMENYQNLDYTTRQYSEIVDMWKQHGLGPDKHLAFYCGTGWRGSEAFINAWLLGWPRVSVFDGGWFEWSNDESNPIETGVPEQVSSE